MLRHVRFTGGIPVRMSIRRKARQFLAQLGQTRSLQLKVLRSLLSLNQSSDFAKNHGLHDQLTVESFQRQMPIADFEYFRPWVEQVKEGRTKAFLGDDNKLVMFAMSSGTTALPKYIPITTRFVEQYRAGWQMWGIHIFEEHRRLLWGKLFQLSGHHCRFETPAGVPCGNISGLVSSMQSPLVKSLYTTPAELSLINDHQTKLYAAIRTTLSTNHLTMMTTANPSTLLQMVDVLQSHSEELIRDLYDGTFHYLGEETSALPDWLMGRLCRRERSRARQLAKLLDTEGTLRPRAIWPMLSLLCVWTGGAAGAYLPRLKQVFENLPVRDHGLSASEGRMTIPLQDEEPSGLLDIASHFYEFIPEDEKSQERPHVLLADELEIGRNYYILLTTASGLSRYDIGDVVQCTGYRQTTPLLKFLHKGKHAHSFTGEKLTEHQVVMAARTTFGDAPMSYFTLAPVWAQTPGYHLIVEEPMLRRFDGDRHKLAARFDEELSSINCEYHEKRATGRLKPIQTEVLPAGLWDQFITQKIRQRMGATEQYKHPCLTSDQNYLETLQNYVLHAKSELRGPHRSSRIDHLADEKIIAKSA